MNRRYLLGLLAVVLVAGIAVAAGVIVNFEHHQTGDYRGPGVPVGKEYSFTVNASGNASDSYYTIPIFMNTSDNYYVNVTVSATSYPGGAGNVNGQIFGLMNQSDYSLFTTNVSMNYLIDNSGNWGYSYEGHGMQTFYAVFVNELNVPFTYSSMEIFVTVIQGNN